jgi:addiction module HigA family antidote
MPMKEPPYPGDTVRHDCLEPLELSVAQAAKVLGVSVGVLNHLFYRNGGISPDMAIRLDKAFGGTAEAWLALQTAYDLAQARKKEHSITVRPYVGKGAVRLPMLAEDEDALTLQNKAES